MKKQILFPLVLLICMSLACSFTINLPMIKTGPTQTLDINEPLPDNNDPVSLDISMGAGTLNLSDGASNLLEGQIKHNVTGWDPEIYRSGNNINLKQGIKNHIDGIPHKKLINEWNLKLGNHPFDLKIAAGAYKSNMNLSGVPLRNLEITDGASQVKIRFDSPNPEEMSRLSYQTGASQVEIYGLGNANLSEMNFTGGAGSYTFDFSGEIKSDIKASITSGVSKITIQVPHNTPVTVNIHGTLQNVNPSGTWTVSDSTYYTQGLGPQIIIDVDMELGSLDLISQ